GKSHYNGSQQVWERGQGIIWHWLVQGLFRVVVPGRKQPGAGLVRFCHKSQPRPVLS
ncbi:hypothetical protein BGY98DRAFT_984222, partial [Russula aff. rugulosa BPL654]